MHSKIFAHSSEGVVQNDFHSHDMLLNFGKTWFWLQFKKLSLAFQTWISKEVIFQQLEGGHGKNFTT